MRVAVMGAGGLGGVIGAFLARAGEDVAFVARGAHLEAIRERGLTVESPVAGTFTVPALATDDPAGVGAVDLVVFGVKSYGLEEAAGQMRPLLGPDTVVLPVQNGIDAAERIGRLVGMNKVLAGTSYVGGTIVAPGVIRHNKLFNKLIFGEPDGGSSARTDVLRATLERAGFIAEVPTDIRVALWEKFCLLTATGGVTAMTRLSFGPIFACPETRDLFRGAIAEAHAVGQTYGVPLAHDFVDRSMEQLAGLPPETRGSMGRDLEAGKRLEIESLNGTVARLGRELGVPTPLNFAVYAALKPYADGTPSGSFAREPALAGRA